MKVYEGVTVIDPFAAAIDIEPAIAEKADQRHSEFGRKFDRKARRRTDGGEDRNTGHQGFLHQFETRAAADEKDLVRKRQLRF